MTAQYIRCADCDKLLMLVDSDGVTTFSQYRIVSYRRLCTKCADDAENMREMGYSPYKTPPRPDTMRESGEEARRMEEKLEKYPPVPDKDREEGDYTFLSTLKYKKLIDPMRVVEVVTTHALATHDINTWLDILNDPATPETERDNALKRLKETASEYRWLCEKRDEIMEKIQTTEKVGNQVTVTWRVS